MVSYLMTLMTSKSMSTQVCDKYFMFHQENTNVHAKS
jgi:hypothetical protein